MSIKFIPILFKYLYFWYEQKSNLIIIRTIMSSSYKTDNKQKVSTLPLKSINGRRCLSKCHPKGATYLHPTFLTEITTNVDSCAIDPIYSKEAEYQGMISADACRLDDNRIFQPPDELESMLLTFYFNPYDFLTTIYGLNSFEEVIYWTLENDYLPFDTIKRIHNCAWKVFGNRPEELSTTVFEYYYDIAKMHWLRDYAELIEKKYSFDLTTNKINVGNAIDEIYSILLSKFFNYNFFISAIKRYIYEYQDQWEEIYSHYGNLKKYIFDQLINYIEKETRK